MSDRGGRLRGSCARASERGTLAVTLVTKYSHCSKYKTCASGLLRPLLARSRCFYTAQGSCGGDAVVMRW